MRQSVAIRMRWTVMTMLGFTLGMGLAIVLGEPVERILPAAVSATVIGMMAITIALTCAGGGLLGAAQWLSDKLPAAWIACTAAGLGLGAAVGTALVEHAAELIAGRPLRFVGLPLTWQLIALAAVGATIGVFLGLAQGLALDRAKAPGWILRVLPAATVALPASLLAVSGVFGGIGSTSAFVMFLLIAGAFFGFVTGAPRLRMAER